MQLLSEDDREISERERYRVFEIRDRSSSMTQWRSLCLGEQGAHVGSLDDNAAMSLSWDHPLGTSGEEHWPQNMLLYDQPRLCDAPNLCCYQGGGVNPTVCVFRS